MQLSDPSDGRYSINYSELFEAGFYKLQHTYPLLMEALDYIHWALERTPHQETERVIAPEDEQRDFRLFITPRTRRYPSLRVLLEIDGKRIHLWHVSVRD